MLFLAFIVAACSSGDPRPEDLYPEDTCALCRMAISDIGFAAELVTADGDVFKFDDIGCMQHYHTMRPEVKGATVFYRDYAGNRWLREQEAVVVETGAATPMGSGLVAFADSVRAMAFLRDNPVNGE